MRVLRLAFLLTFCGASLLLDPSRVAGSVQANADLLAAEEAAWGIDDPRLLPTLQRQYDLLRAAKERKAARAVKKRIRALE